MTMASTQRKFRVAGKNLITISNMLLGNQNVCKLLYYTTKTPLSEPTITDVDFLMGKNIRLVPKVPDDSTDRGSFIIVLLEDYEVDPTNEEVKVMTIRFDVVCPIDIWSVDEESLRPFLIMSEIDEMFNGLQLKGIGKLRFIKATRIVMSEVYAGYSMVFSNYEFN